MSIELFEPDGEAIAYQQSKIGEIRTRIALLIKHFRSVMNGEIYLSGEDVCKLLHISKRTLQHYRDSHILPYLQIGGKIIYRQSDILHVLERNYVTIPQE